MDEISVKTGSRIEMLDITSQVRSALSKSGTQEGVCTVYCPHTTAAITINENADPDVTADIMQKLNRMIPLHENYRHLEGNSDAHIKSSLVGNSAQIIISNGTLQLGTWQGIYFCEFDGPRRRSVWVSII
ncbi:MAG: secondary thiamine-phosphate synthase enzyme YjbQ [Candidatus Marinimicrobia bacterium]|nr:secondary thiamine-phosphate synthase enzyme YjbQ [bacterium]MCG2715740.1 secondary thiamine-phosphate synthase enzyme YjbQ [Candidatus Neomarinimicrobiota bacterium]